MPVTGTNERDACLIIMDEKSREIFDSDAEWVDRCQKGDVEAFRTLVERYQKRVINIAYRMTGDYDDACEVAQEAFLSAFRAMGKFRGEAKFSTWLAGITVNHGKNRRRQQEGRARHEVVSIEDGVETPTGNMPIDPPSGEPSPAEMLEKKELQARVQGCISTLRHEYREVLVLRDVEGYSYEEIGHALGLPEGTIKSRLFRGRDGLKDCLKKFFGDI